MSEQRAAYVAHPHQPGWFDLASAMIKSVLENGGEETTAFLTSMGETLATRYPLPDARTVQDLEREMNLQLARFGWGFVQLQPTETAIQIQHHALPPGDDTLSIERWQLAMGTILSGLYAQWLHAQGGSTAVPLTLEKNDGITLLYQYK